MVAEPWIIKMGNQVSSNLKQAAFYLDKKKTTHSRKSIQDKEKTKNPIPTTTTTKTLGILSFEVANVMSKTVHLHRSLSISEVSKLKAEIFGSKGVRDLVSSDESCLLYLVLAEKIEDLNRVASVVSRLGKRCVEPALQGFEHVYGDIVNGSIDVRELGFLVKDMEAMVRKMERYVNATSNLYCELEVLSELEQATKKFQQNQHEESRKAFEQKLVWQKQDVRHLKEVSLWNQTYDKVVELLARTMCTIYARICVVFGESLLRRESFGGPFSPPLSLKDECSGRIDNYRHVISMQLKRASSDRSRNSCQLVPIERPVVPEKKETTTVKPKADTLHGASQLFRGEDMILPCVASPGRLFMECLSLSSSVSKFDDYEDDSDVVGNDNEDRNSQISGCCSVLNGSLRKERPSNLGISVQAQSDIASNACFSPKSRLTVYAPPSTVGGSALALHYANVIIVIEKLLRYPHLVGEEARDDLYQMLPASLRVSLKTHLKSYVKNLAIYDAPVAHNWKETLDGILKWLAPMAHNMIRWQSERNFEQHQVVKRTNVLLLQTLYFADREKTEAAICQLLVGLNYICRYEQQQYALLDCTSSFDYDDCMEWQLQCRAALS